MKKVLLFLSLTMLSVGCSVDEIVEKDGVTYQVKGTITPLTNVKNGLVAWYPFNGNVNDESGNNNNGVLNGAELTPNRLNKPNSAYNFTNSVRGHAKRIDVDMNTSSITNSLSIVWWVKRNGNGTISPRAFEFWPGSETEGKFAANLPNEVNTMLFEHNIAGENVSFTIPYSTNNEWVHYAYTVGEGQAKFYVNGVLTHTQAVNTTSIKLGNKVAFGRMNHPSYDAFNGVLDDIAVYNRIINQAEINYYYTYQN
jgi:hypothetical protein